MVFIVLLGVGVAIAHQNAYAALNQKPVSRFTQLWANNLRTVAAYIVKTSFTITIGLAFQEILWRTLRGRHKNRILGQIIYCPVESTEFLFYRCFQNRITCAGTCGSSLDNSSYCCSNSWYIGCG